MIMILMINFSARFTLLNTQKESKQKSDYIIPRTKSLNINYDRIAKYYLVTLSFKLLDSVKYFYCFFHSL